MTYNVFGGTLNLALSIYWPCCSARTLCLCCHYVTAIRANKRNEWMQIYEYRSTDLTAATMMSITSWSLIGRPLDNVSRAWAPNCALSLSCTTTPSHSDELTNWQTAGRYKGQTKRQTDCWQ